MFPIKIYKLLTSHALKQGLVVLVDQGLMSLVTFITGVLIARSSSEQEYALYMLGWTVLLSFKGVQEALINLPFTVYAPRLVGSKQELYQGSTLIHTLIFCFMVGVLVLFLDVFNSYQSIQYGFELFELAPLLLFLLSSFVFRDFLRNSLLAQLEIWASVRINGTTSIILITTIGLLYYGQLLIPANTYLLFSIAFGVAALVMYWQHRARYRVDRTLLWLHFLKNWQLGKWALVGNFAFTGSRSSYPWLILYFLDYESVAAYYACLALALAPAPFLRGAGAYVLPRMSHSYKEGVTKDLIRLLRKSILILCVPYLLWLLFGYFLSDEIIELFYVEKFKGYGYLFVLLLVATTIDFVFAPLTNALQVLEKTRAITVSLIIGAFITLILGSFLIKDFGLPGAGLASIISMLGTISWRVYVFYKSVSHN